MAVPRLRTQLATASAVVAVVLVGDSSGVLGQGAAVVLDDGAQLAAGVFAVVCCAVMSVRMPGVERTWRWLLAIGMAGWSAGQVIWSWYQIFASTPLPSPAWSDVGYLTLPVCGFIALLTLAVGKSAPHPIARIGAIPSAQSRPVLLVDGLAVVGSLFMLTWATALGAVVRAGAPNTFAFVVAVAYPVTDLVMVVMALQLLTNRPVPARLRGQVVLLGLGLVGLSLSDSVYAYLISSGAERMPPIANAGFVVGPLLVGLAALRPTGASDPADAAPPRHAARAAGWAQVLLPYVPLLATGVLVADRLATGRGLDDVETLVWTAVLGLVVIRQMITLRDNRTLLARVSAAQNELVHQAFHDPLTGLANRALFGDRLAAAVAGDGRSVALLFIDLDDFKEVNDRFGHGVGDQVLRALGSRLRSCVRAEDTVARLGGDEFGILLIGDDDHAHIGERILASLRDPFRIGAQLVTIQASMGLAVPDPDGAPPSAEGLLRRADAAMYAGKRGGKGSLVRYRPGLTDGPPEPDLSALIVADLADGGGGLDVVYQPIVEMRDGLVVAVEALVRWSHPDIDDVPAEEVVAAAARAGVIDALDDFVLDRACGEVAAYLARYGSAPRLHVNVSAGRLGGADLETSVEHTLCRHGLTGDRIVLEVTEGDAIPDLGAAAHSIRRLRAMGVKVALDDFGTGHNTIVRLHRLPVDIIKIDRTLTVVDALPTRAELLCAWIVALAAGLDLAVIAEGVEHPEQAAALQRAGTRYGQGYLYGRPAPLAAAVPPWAAVPGPRTAPAGEWDADGRMPDLSEESGRGYAREILTPDG